MKKVLLSISFLFLFALVFNSNQAFANVTDGNPWPKKGKTKKCYAYSGNPYQKNLYGSKQNRRVKNWNKKYSKKIKRFQKKSGTY